MYVVTGDGESALHGRKVSSRCWRAVIFNFTFFNSGGVDTRFALRGSARVPHACVVQAEEVEAEGLRSINGHYWGSFGVLGIVLECIDIVGLGNNLAGTFIFDLQIGP